MTIGELAPGMTVRWIHVPRGGYGFPVPVDAVVIKICARLVRIEVALRDGRKVKRVVHPDSLRKAL